MNLFKLSAPPLKHLGYLIIFLVASILSLSYYSVVLLVLAPTFISASVFSFFIIILFHILLVMWLWCYFKVMFKDPGLVPDNWRQMPVLSGGNLEDGTSCVNDYDVPEVLVGSAAGGLDRRPAVGFCNHCQNGKPPRCHHCSVCRRCVLKMDHHCIWVVNCVGACNYKFFLLFLLYTFLETTLDTLVLLPSFIKFFDNATDHSSNPGDLAVIFVSFVLNLAFALSLLCFIVMHASLLSTNTTSVEVHEKKGVVRWKYDLGSKKNFEQVFGTKKALWLLPLFSKEDLDNIRALHGLHFPTRSDVEA